MYTICAERGFLLQAGGLLFASHVPDSRINALKAVAALSPPPLHETPGKQIAQEQILSDNNARK